MLTELQTDIIIEMLLISFISHHDPDKVKIEERYTESSPCKSFFSKLLLLKRDPNLTINSKNRSTDPQTISILYQLMEQQWDDHILHIP